MSHSKKNKNSEYHVSKTRELSKRGLHEINEEYVATWISSVKNYHIDKAELCLSLAVDIVNGQKEFKTLGGLLITTNAWIRNSGSILFYIRDAIQLLKSNLALLPVYKDRRDVARLILSQIWAIMTAKHSHNHVIGNPPANFKLTAMTYNPNDKTFIETKFKTVHHLDQDITSVDYQFLKQLFGQYQKELKNTIGLVTEVTEILKPFGTSITKGTQRLAYLEDLLKSTGTKIFKITKGKIRDDFTANCLTDDYLSIKAKYWDPVWNYVDETVNLFQIRKISAKDALRRINNYKENKMEPNSDIDNSEMENPFDSNSNDDRESNSEDEQQQEPQPKPTLKRQNAGLNLPEPKRARFSDDKDVVRKPHYGGKGPQNLYNPKNQSSNHHQDHSDDEEQQPKKPIYYGGGKGPQNFYNPKNTPSYREINPDEDDEEESEKPEKQLMGPPARKIFGIGGKSPRNIYNTNNQPSNHHQDHSDDEKGEKDNEDVVNLIANTKNQVNQTEIPANSSSNWSNPAPKMIFTLPGSLLTPLTPETFGVKTTVRKPLHPTPGKTIDCLPMSTNMGPISSLETGNPLQMDENLKDGVFKALVPIEFKLPAHIKRIHITELHFIISASDITPAGEMVAEMLAAQVPVDQPPTPMVIEFTTDLVKPTPIVVAPLPAIENNDPMQVDPQSITM